jgi:hypothetical protein
MCYTFQRERAPILGARKKAKPEKETPSLLLLRGKTGGSPNKGTLKQ